MLICSLTRPLRLVCYDGDLSYPAGEKPMKIKKAREMYDKFMSLYPKVSSELEKIFLFLVEESKKNEISV